MPWRRGKAYSQDLRDRVFAAADAGKAVGQIAAALQVSVSYVSKALSRRERTGVATALPQRGHVAPKLAGLHEDIRARVAARPDATIGELRAWLRAERQVLVSGGVVWSTLAKLKLTLKKVVASCRTGPARGRRGARQVA
jgi:transposase